MRSVIKMKDVLIGLEAEVLSTTPEMVIDEKQQFIIVAGLLFLCVLSCVVLHVYRRVSSDSDMRVHVLFVLVGLVGLLIVLIEGVVFDPPQKSSGKTIFEILINDQTNMHGILEQFEVVDTSNYPILTVKSK